MLIEIQAARLELLAERAVWLVQTRSLLVADLHVGKAQSFRRLGVPVPAGTTAATLARLDRLMTRYCPSELIILGDLLHGPLSQQGPAIDALAQWRAKYPEVAVSMVRGNHDSAAGDPAPECRIEVMANPCERAGLALCHVPGDAAGRFVIAGHLHPSLTLRGRTDRVRTPCFWLRSDALVLPAFGEFTGGWAVRPRPGERVFAIAEDRVIEVPVAAGRVLLGAR